MKNSLTSGFHQAIMYIPQVKYDSTVLYVVGVLIIKYGST